jgi:hypothetical protein
LVRNLATLISIDADEEKLRRAKAIVDEKTIA